MKLFFLFAILVLSFNKSYSQSNMHKSTLSLTSGITILATISEFDPNKHEIDSCNFGKRWGVCLVDNELIFGTDWEMPKTKLEKMILNLNNVTINLDVTGMFNPTSDFVLRNGQFRIQEIGAGLQVTGLFSDGAASYLAEWQIVKGHSIRTMLTNNENLLIDFIDTK